MEFIETYNLTGLIIGILTFVIIGFFHPVVIKAEYYFGTGCWWVFLLAGLLGILGCIVAKNVLLSSVLGVFAFSSLWSISELFQQKERVDKGWFPKNPKR